MKKQDRSSNRLSWKLTITWTLVVSVILSACGAGAPQTPPTPTVQPTSTATLTPAPTVTPSPTLTATATATPDPSQIALSLGLPLGDARNPVTYRIDGDNLVYEKSGVVAAVKENGEWKLMWTKLLEGRGEYKRPDVPLVMGGVSPAANWEIDSRMSASAVYKDILAAQTRALLLPENGFIWKQMILEHPEWESLPGKFTGMSAGLPENRSLREAMMTRFMELSKGLINLKLWPSRNIALVDFNKPVVFECEQVEKVPSILGGIILPTSDSIAMGVYTDAEGKMVVHVELTSKVWSNGDSNDRPRGANCSMRMLQTLESQAQGEDNSLFHTNSQPFTNFRLYLYGLQSPKNFFSYHAVGIVGTR